MGEYIDTREAASRSFDASNQSFDYDVLVVGAGLSGIYSLYRLKELGFRAKVIEAGSDVGGTWFWNRYPGARLDCESFSYCYSFSQELLDEWDWSEHFATQTDLHRYMRHVTEKFDLRKDIQFNTRIKSMHFQDTTRSWLLTDDNNVQYTSRFIVSCIGFLSEPTLPDIPGVHDFKGVSYHTARWPSEQIDLADKRVCIIGTGSTGIQLTQTIAKDVGHLTVLQRRANWAVPLNNSDILPEEMADIRKKYPDIFKLCAETFLSLPHDPCTETRRSIDIPADEREAFWEALYLTPGFRKWLSNYGDIAYDREANRLYSEFVAKKIRQRVNDPITAEKLVPKDHGFGTKRVPLEIGYYECFNQPNVKLVDLKENPIERITEKGIQTKDEFLEFDVIVYATGFAAVTGAFDAVDIRGVGGVKLMDRWMDGPQTFLGIFVEDFPNMTMILGPHQPFGNMTRCIEHAGGFIMDFLSYARDHNITYVNATREGVEAWTEHTHECAKGLLSNEVDSWGTGVNKNVAHRQKRTVATYAGPVPGYRKRCEEVKAKNYSDLNLA